MGKGEGLEPGSLVDIHIDLFGTFFPLVVDLFIWGFLLGTFFGLSHPLFRGEGEFCE